MSLLLTATGVPHRRRAPPPVRQDEIFNIIPIHGGAGDRLPEIRAVEEALLLVGDLRKPPFREWVEGMDLLDWIGGFFGFQRDNVKNQREHIVLHLANSQLRLPHSTTPLYPPVLRHFRRKLLCNYTSWCSYTGRRSSIRLSRKHRGSEGNERDLRRELLYLSLYLLIWGEAANLRFLPECLSFIFHNMAMELNRILDGDTDDYTGQPYVPSFTSEKGEENDFLNHVISPIYNTVVEEAKLSRNGAAPHSSWRNYDDINEFFWSRRRCSQNLQWPIDPSAAGSNFFTTWKKKTAGKTGFVEQRSFWNIFRSFDRLWVLLILFFQASVIIAWEGSVFPWEAVREKDVQVKLLTLFVTWASLRFLQSVLDAVTQHSLVSRETVFVGVRMVLKITIAVTWIILFAVFYGRIWEGGGRWSNERNQRITRFLELTVVFMAPEFLASIFFLLPWLRNFVEEKEWRVFYLATWWFQTRTFVGRGLREGVITRMKYTLFWLAVLGSKFSFSYFLQIKPLVSPTKSILHLKRGDVRYSWHEFFYSTNRVGVVLLWAPVILIYAMDLQIWYAIFSSLVGGLVGLFLHLGEIRNMEQLRLRFQFFVGALQFNLIAEEEEACHLQARTGEKGGTVMKRINDAMHRLKLRYGVGQPYKKIESNQREATRFALVWNEIVAAMREEDLISDGELDLLELLPTCWNIRVVRWPCLLLCNELLLALHQAVEMEGKPDSYLWLKICKNEYRRCSVIEAYDSMKYIILAIVKQGTEEHSIVSTIFGEVDYWVDKGKITEVFRLSLLPKLHAGFTSLLRLATARKGAGKKDAGKVVTVLQELYQVTVRELPRKKRSTSELIRQGLAPPTAVAAARLLFENAVVFPAGEDDSFYRQVARVQTIFTSRDAMHDLPANMEARRRIAFFCNSVFMNMPRAPKVEKMMAFTVLTPYCDEEVLYGKEMLRSENEDGISTLFYLQKIYEDEWENFRERMKREGAEEDGDIWKDKGRELRQWASYRGQTLSRTVRGMMYYQRALNLLSSLDSSSSAAVAAADPGGENHRMKFTYVLACEMYVKHRAKGDPRAEEILYLMKKYESLRVAYVDVVMEAGEGEGEGEERKRHWCYYSVLVKYDRAAEKEVEIYRVRLPGPLRIGEGKAENQNHALIFTRGEALQTIDMNQDNSLEESLKMRNLLEEFRGSSCPRILGIREHVFTGSVSSLAWFMSAQETSFVTVGQRVLSNPLKVRMHYGRSDVFDRLWFISRGGVSKASPVVNISEDIFGGFNCTLRGGEVAHSEYIQVGKGRDVGLNQISMFEAKAAGGNGEQLLSRDVYRLGHRLDFFRMLSFFYTTVGLYFNSMLVILTVYTFLWGRLYLSLSGEEKAVMEKTGHKNTALVTILSQQFVVQLGVLTALPMVVESSLENGFLHSLWEYMKMEFQLFSIFYTFCMGTRAHYFGRTTLHGGARHRAAARGFVVQHRRFSENYRMYSRSHFVKGVELGVILVVYASYSGTEKKSLVYVGTMTGSWFLVLSWVMSPFVFNPSGFDWLKTVYDFGDFMNWIWYKGGVFDKAEQSWETWWYEENSHLRTGGLWAKIVEVILETRFFLFQYGIVYQLHITGDSRSISVYLLSWIYVVVSVTIYIAVAYAQAKYEATERHIYYRLVQVVVITAAALVILILLRLTAFQMMDLVKSFLAFIPTGWGLISVSLVLKPFLDSTVVWNTVVSLARVYDMLLGVLVMAPVAVLSWLPGFQSMQTRILFNEAFTRGLHISQIVAGKGSGTPPVDIPRRHR